MDPALNLVKPYPDFPLPVKPNITENLYNFKFITLYNLVITLVIKLVQTSTNLL